MPPGIRYRRSAQLGAALLLAASLAVSGHAQSQSLELRNVAQAKVPGKVWQWTAFVSGPRNLLDRVECVEYTLHPTFPDPVRRICDTRDSRYPFGLYAEGWGTFNLRAKVEFKDGSSRDLVHMLNF